MRVGVEVSVGVSVMVGVKVRVGVSVGVNVSVGVGVIDGTGVGESTGMVVVGVAVAAASKDAALQPPAMIAKMKPNKNKYPNRFR